MNARLFPLGRAPQRLLVGRPMEGLVLLNIKALMRVRTHACPTTSCPGKMTVTFYYVAALPLKPPDL